MKMKLWMLALLALMLVIPAAVQNATAQKTGKKDDASKKKSQSFVLKGMKIEAGRGSDDPNIKDDNMKNSANQEFPGPKEKGATSTARGAAGVCKVVLDNRTRWKIKIYVDDSYRGMMAPYGDSVAYTGSGLTRVYARAEFDDGSAYYWGPTDYTCYDGQIINFRMDN